MMKYFNGICCAMLLCFTACDEVDNPEFPPARVEVADVQKLNDLSFGELQQMNDLTGNEFRTSWMFVFEGNVIVDSPYQSYNNVEYFISYNKEYLSEEFLQQNRYNSDYVMNIQPDHRYEQFKAFWNLDWMDWDDKGVDTYYYRMVASRWSWGNKPGILDECLQQDGGQQATYSEIKSVKLPVKYLPYADYSFSYDDDMMHAIFYLYGLENVKQIGVCYSADNDLPTVANQTYTADAAASEEVVFPVSQLAGPYYIRPFVVTKDDVRVYGYVQMLHINR